MSLPVWALVVVCWLGFDALVVVGMASRRRPKIRVGAAAPDAVALGLVLEHVAPDGEVLEFRFPGHWLDDVCDVLAEIEAL